MNLRFSIFFLWLLIGGGLCQAQTDTLTREELRAMASESFDKGDFASASVYYKKLLGYYPKDPVYNFRLGACNTELGEDIQGALRMLEFASFRLSPPEVHYYLGLAHQKQGEFDLATASYNKYLQLPGKKEMPRKEVEMRLAECRSHTKPNNAGNVVVQTEVKGNAPVPERKQDSVKVVPVEKKELPEPGRDIFAGESGYMSMLNEALRIQMTSDSLVRLSEEKRRELAREADWNTKKKLMAEINVLQTEADNLQSSANAIYSKARQMEKTFVNGQDKEQSGSVKVKESTQNKQVVPKDTVFKLNQKTNAADTTQIPVVQYIMQFEIRDNPAYSDSNAIPVDQPLPSGVIYKIQVGVYSKPAVFSLFRGLYPMSAEKIVGNGFIRYYAGIFNAIKDAEISLERVRNYGYREAFLVSFYNGKKISLIRAREIEQMVQKN